MLLVAGCASEPSAAPAVAPTPSLPDGRAGDVLRRALAAAGGWERWQAARDVSYISMLTVVDPGREVTSDSIGLVSAPLHGRARARMDSIGLPSEVRFGFDGERTWILSDGAPVLAPGQLAVSRFELVSSRFWFSLPFRLAEEPVEVSYAGAERGPDGERWERLRADFPAADPGAPGPWVVVYVDAETGLIDRVHGELSAPFLRHPLWVGQWLRYRDCGGFTKERQRKFFPADADGNIVGAMVAEQFVEHVEFDHGFPAERFAAPDDDEAVARRPAAARREAGR